MKLIAVLYFYIDQCPSMAVAIPRVLTRALHKLCRWHMLKKFTEPLGEFYRLHPRFRDEFRAIVNWPLLP